MAIPPASLIISANGPAATQACTSTIAAPVGSVLLRPDGELLCLGLFEDLGGPDELLLHPLVSNVQNLILKVTLVSLVVEYFHQFDVEDELPVGLHLGEQPLVAVPLHEVEWRRHERPLVGGEVRQNGVVGRHYHATTATSPHGMNGFLQPSDCPPIAMVHQHFPPAILALELRLRRKVLHGGALPVGLHVALHKGRHELTPTRRRPSALLKVAEDDA
mmetsp:Transcript_8599/g.21161  ORF Transcript_8599/g.21161 Transcript_8599/m.21161 type:complete len:218 (-) Transcript_8599:551-1204(-)